MQAEAGLTSGAEAGVQQLGAEFSSEELRSLDSEGRAVVTRHRTSAGHLAVINVYCPRADAENAERVRFKQQFYKALDIRANCLQGRKFLSQQQQHSDPSGWVKQGQRRSPAYARRQERRRAARQARQSAAEAEKPAEEMLAKEAEVSDNAVSIPESPVSVVVYSECRSVKPRDKWMKEDISLIESVIFDTVTSLENVYEDRVVRCRHCRRHSKDVQFYTYVSTTTLWYPSYITTI